MSIALSAGVTGLECHQKMLDVAGNNVSNVNTVAFKASRITFSEMLSETLKKASAPTTTIGGTNPQQMGHGVQVAGITPNMAQGNLVDTGNPLDMGLEGEGYFSLDDGSKEVYTRAGAFAVDAQSRLVDPATGYIVQRIGTVGEADNFQTPGDGNVNIPYDVQIRARATTEVKVAGNLSADGSLATAQTNVLTSNIAFTKDGTPAAATDKISELDQYTGTFTSGTFTFSGYKPNGTTLAGATPSVDVTLDVTSTTTLQDVLDYLNTDEGGSQTSEVQTVTLSGGGGNDPDGGTFTLTYGGVTTASIDWDATASEIEDALEALTTVDDDDITVSAPIDDGVTFTFDSVLGDVGLITITSSLTDSAVAISGDIAETQAGHGPHGVLGSEATATLVGGKIRITDAASGYSRSDFKMAWTDNGTGSMTLPAYFEVTTAGGEEVKNVNITVFDSLGGKHVLSSAFVRTNVTNEWDMILTSISGDITDITFDNRRIRGLEFYASNGAYSGLDSTINDTAQFIITFDNDPANPQTIGILTGTAGQFDGLTQFAGNSTAVAREQDGYEAGSFSSLSVSNTGTLIGVFTNGIKKELADLKIALFQNPSALEAVGNGYFIPSANSGQASATQALSAGAGSVRGGALEQSNAEVASEFVAMIQAQNGFQANARTIRIANDILRELTNLIR